MPSRGLGLATAVAKMTLSPIRTTVDPCACFASFPVSNESRLPPASSTEMSCFMVLSFCAGEHCRGDGCADERVPVAILWGPGTHNAVSSGCRTRQGDSSIPERTAGAGTKRRQLLAKAYLLNDGLVALGIVLLEVIQQATPLADQHEKTAARAVILLVRFEVLRQLADAFA